MRPSTDAARIVSLVPAATECCFCLNAWDAVVGVSHECDFPPSARHRPAVTRPKVDPKLPSRALDEAVRRVSHRQEGIWMLDEDLLRELAPTLIVSQRQCEACGVAPKELDLALRDWAQPPRMAYLDATTYEEALAALRNLGEVLGRRDEAKQLLLRNWGLAKEIRSRTSRLPKPRVAILDWIDPPMFAGHWIPELAEMANGEYTLVASGKPSRKGSWEELEEYEPDVIVAAPCGRTPQQTAAELADVLRREDQADQAAVLNGRVFACDGNAYFNRPGPRLVYAAGLMARAFHYGRVPPLPEPIERALVPVHV